MSKIKNPLGSDNQKHSPNNVNEDKKDDSPTLQEYGGSQGLEPTRYGDWEKNGRCIDF